MDEQWDAVTEVALRARRGDAAAATAFVRATQTDVWRLCAHLGSRDTADDLTQETYARAFASLHRFAGRSSARTWLLGIARRVCADAVRAAVRSRAVTIPDVPVVSDVADGVAVQGLLAELDAERREAFVLTQLVGPVLRRSGRRGGLPGRDDPLAGRPGARRPGDRVRRHRGEGRRHGSTG